MIEREALAEMNAQLDALRRAAEALKARGLRHGMPAAVKNAERVLASAQMLALHIADPLALAEAPDEP